MKWKPLSLDGRYEISDSGRVRSWTDSHGGRAAKPHFLKPQVSNSGYAQVRLQDNHGARRWRWHSVHRMVAYAFCICKGAPTEQVNHKNGNKLDNRASNLEWSTASLNAKHAYRVLGRTHPRPGAGKFGALNKKSRRVLQTFSSGKTKVWAAVSDAMRAGYSQSNISAVCAGRRKTHAGCTWKFI